MQQSGPVTEARPCQSGGVGFWRPGQQKEARKVSLCRTGSVSGCGTQIASEIALELMVWPSADRKFGWFVEPTYSYSFSRGHEQSIGVTTGLAIAHIRHAHFARYFVAAITYC
jgi:hypothetical protein